MKKIRGVLAAIAVLPLALGGCASTDSENPRPVSLQPVSVVAVDEAGTEVQGANCTLSNEEGTWSVSTPDTASVQRSTEALTIVCTKDGHKKGSLTVESGTIGTELGNRLFNGIIGVVVGVGMDAAFGMPSPVGPGGDAFTGALSSDGPFDYPTSVQVIMGQDVHIGKEETEEE